MIASLITVLLVSGAPAAPVDRLDSPVAAAADDSQENEAALYKAGTAALDKSDWSGAEQAFTKVVELKGTVKKWSLVNPHPILLLEVTDDSGMKTDWDVYFGPSAAGPLRRQGYTPETFRVGETVIVKAHPSTGVGVRGVDVWGRGVGVTRGRSGVRGGQAGVTGSIAAGPSSRRTW